MALARALRAWTAPVLVHTAPISVPLLLWGLLRSFLVTGGASGVAPMLTAAAGLGFVTCVYLADRLYTSSADSQGTQDCSQRSVTGQGRTHRKTSTAATPRQTAAVLDPARMFTCPVCLGDHSCDEVFAAAMCGHQLCRECAREVALTAIRSHEFPIPCPICKAGGNPACRLCSMQAKSSGRRLLGPCTLDGDLPLLLGPEEYSDYLRKSLLAATRSSEELVSCPRDVCNGVAALPLSEARFDCPLCQHAWCRTCKTDWHEGVSCAKNKKRASKLESLSRAGFKCYLKRHRTIPCPNPNCQHGLQRIDGCNRIRCACGQNVCWRCGSALSGRTPEELYAHFNNPKSKCYRKTFEYRI